MPSFKTTFGQALATHVGPNAFLLPGHARPGRLMLFGNAASADGALRVTFDGWIAKVGPATLVQRMPEREYCSLAGILGAALAMSELFLSFADISVEAGRRVVALSLWRPDLPITDPAALGLRVEFLPRSLWVLGLGHLGNAYLWSLASLPYSNPKEVELFLNDFDQIEDENIETSLLFGAGKTGYKTRTCSEWLESRGFQTRLIERPFDANFRRRDDEPGLALCGFDSNPARRDLATAQFLRAVESGLGGTANNFDTVNLHTFPNPRPASELWPDLTPEETAKIKDHEERLVKENAGYRDMDGDECGRYKLAGIHRRALCRRGRRSARHFRDAPPHPSRTGLHRHQACVGGTQYPLSSDRRQLRRWGFCRTEILPRANVPASVAHTRWPWSSGRKRPDR